MTSGRLLLAALACLVLMGVYVAIYPQLTSRGIACPAWLGLVLIGLTVGLPIAAAVKGILAPARCP